MEQQNNSPENKRKWLSTYAKWSGLAFTMIAVILVGVFGGRALDNKLENDFPTFTLIFTILSLIFAFYYLIKTVTRK